MKGWTTAALVAIGVVCEGIYLGITVQLPWWPYAGSLTSWSALLGKSETWFAACLVGVVVLMLAYLGGWWAIRRGLVGRVVIWAFAGLFALTLFWLLPITSDLFIYLGRAHLFTDLGGNPLHDALLANLHDPLLSAYPASYARQSSVYGPVWSLLSAPATLGPYDVAGGVAYLKALALASYAGCAWLLDRIVSRLRPGTAVEALYLFTWNPLVLLMAVGDGHNDTSMMVLVLAAAWLLLEERWILAFTALSLAVWLKYVAGIFFPLFVLHAWRRWEDTSPHPLPLLLEVGVPATGVTLLAFAPFRRGEELGPIARRLLAPMNWGGRGGDLPQVGMIVGLLLFIAAYILLARQVARGSGSYQLLANACFAAAFLAFVLGAVRSQPWHLIWPAAMAGLSGRRWAWPAVAVLSGIMLLAQVWVEWGTPGLGGP